MTPDLVARMGALRECASKVAALLYEIPVNAPNTIGLRGYDLADALTKEHAATLTEAIAALRSQEAEPPRYIGGFCQDREKCLARNAELATLKAATDSSKETTAREWLPIETAPFKNEPLVVLTKQGNICDADNYAGLWNMPIHLQDDEPIAWVHRPETPAAILSRFGLDKEKL